MKVLIVGSGGREHALIWKVSQNPKVKEIYAIPGNGGTEEVAKNVDLSVNEITKIAEFAKEKEIDITIVGPEAPLVGGIVDEFEKHGLNIFGPSQKAAIIEGSKVFAKQFMKKYKIPTADFEIASSANEAYSIIKKGRFPYPLVIKADGLAGGKGSIIVKNEEEAKKALEDIMIKKVFGNAGERVVIEEFLEGHETSFMVITDGKRVFPLVTSKDYKKAYDGDKGPNTGGMGAISPSPFIDSETIKKIIGEIIYPTIEGMTNESRVFRGVLYAGLMLTSDGPKVLEYNCRFGDPETQVIMLRMESDLIEVVEGVINKRLLDAELEWSENVSGCVVVASGGYPLKYEKGKEIQGVARAKMIEGVQIFHAGTKKENGKLLTSGGRVLNVCATAPSLKTAMDKIYTAISFIYFEKMFYRKDIGIERR